MCYCQRQSAGFTYVEVIVSLVIMSVAVVTGLEAFGMFAQGARLQQEQMIAADLADQMMAEISIWPFADPEGTVGIGLENGESLSDRQTFDDVDDYDGWSQMPPVTRSGEVMTDYADFQRSISVQYDAEAADLLGLSLTQLKRITVNVSCGDKSLAARMSIRADHNANAPVPPPIP